MRCALLLLLLAACGSDSVPTESGVLVVAGIEQIVPRAPNPFTFTAVRFDTVVRAPAGEWVDGERWVAPEAGAYDFAARVTFGGAGENHTVLALILNDETILASTEGPRTGAPAPIEVATRKTLSPGDVVRVSLFHQGVETEGRVVPGEANTRFAASAVAP